jgi:hypothetical protein
MRWIAKCPHCGARDIYQATKVYKDVMFWDVDENKPARFAGTIIDTEGFYCAECEETFAEPNVVPKVAVDGHGGVSDE